MEKRWTTLDSYRLAIVKKHSKLFLDDSCHDGKDMSDSTAYMLTFTPDQLEE